jgi:ribosome biogenesis GTPase
LPGFSLSLNVGTVLRSHAGGYLVHLPSNSQGVEEDLVIFCQARGRLKKQKMSILTGDRVELDELNYPERTAVIVQHQKRKTFIDRPPLANIDQVIIVQAVRQPDFSPLWMDRYLVHFQLAVPFTRPIICLNKCDLEDDYGLSRLRSIYEPLGYFVIFASAETGQGLEELARALHGKISVFSGPSGAGKSSLLNKISPGLDIKVGRMENSFGVGRHTTTYSELYELKLDGYMEPRETSPQPSPDSLINTQQPEERVISWVADTPGFNVMEFDLSEPRALLEQFEEIFALGEKCRFSNCLHMVEDDCAVRDSELIAESRYESYCLMMIEAQELEQIARVTSSKKEATVKRVGGAASAGGKAVHIPKLHGRYRAAARNTEKQKVQSDDVDAEIYDDELDRSDDSDDSDDLD